MHFQLRVEIWADNLAFEIIITLVVIETIDIDELTQGK